MISDERFAEALRIAMSAIKDAQEQTQDDFTLSIDNTHP